MSRIVLFKYKPEAPDARVYFTGDITLVETETGEVAPVPQTSLFIEEAFEFSNEDEAWDWSLLISPGTLTCLPLPEPIPADQVPGLPDIGE